MYYVGRYLIFDNLSKAFLVGNARLRTTWRFFWSNWTKNLALMLTSFRSHTSSRTHLLRNFWTWPINKREIQSRLYYISYTHSTRLQIGLHFFPSTDGAAILSNINQAARRLESPTYVFYVIYNSLLTFWIVFSILHRSGQTRKRIDAAIRFEQKTRIWYILKLNHNTQSYGNDVKIHTNMYTLFKIRFFHI